ncbi:MAG: hypothetical protein AAGE98_20810 [Actinomycetota bacterium]
MDAGILILLALVVGATALFVLSHRAGPIRRGGEPGSTIGTGWSDDEPRPGEHLN